MAIGRDSYPRNTDDQLHRLVGGAQTSARPRVLWPAVSSICRPGSASRTLPVTKEAADVAASSSLTFPSVYFDGTSTISNAFGVNSNSADPPCSAILRGVFNDPFSLSSLIWICVGYCGFPIAS